MRLLVDTATHASASASLVGGNHVAALAYGPLTTTLAGSGAMAGSDATAASFAHGYDAAARDAVRGLGDLVDAFGGLARLTGTSHDNWVRAESRSTTARSPAYDEGEQLPVGPVTVHAAVLPSSLGGDAVDLPPFWNEIVDHLQGFAWPDADTGRLRDSARAWRDAAVDVDLLTTYCDDAGHRIADLRAPEVPLARQAFRRLRVGAGDLAREYRALATSCDDYATAVETHRTTVRGIVHELVAEAVESAALGLALGLLSGGAGTAVGSALAGTRIAVAVRRIVETLRALRDLCRLKTAVALDGVVTRLAPIRAVFVRFAQAGVLRFAPLRAPTTERVPLLANALQLQKKFKHAKELGVLGQWSPAQANRFRTALEEFLNRDSLTTIRGSYRGNDVILSLDRKTGMCVLQKPDGALVSVWKLSLRQTRHVLKTGVLGGG